jgi:hypothetical protein
LKRLINTGKAIEEEGKAYQPFPLLERGYFAGLMVNKSRAVSGRFKREKKEEEEKSPENPASIYHLIPLFCQPESGPLKPFSAQIRGTSGMQLAGLSSKTWGDYLSTILEPQEKISSLACSATYFAISTDSGTIKGFNQVTSQEVKTLRNKHKTPVELLRFRTKESILAWSDSKTLLIWDTSLWT